MRGDSDFPPHSGAMVRFPALAVAAGGERALTLPSGGGGPAPAAGWAARAWTCIADPPASADA